MSLRAATLLACGFSVGMALLAAWRCDWTSDEPYHLFWSDRFLSTGETERASQDWLNSKTPASLANVVSGRLARALGASDKRALRFAQRLPTLLWLGLLLATTFAAAREIAGERAAPLATIATALDPNLAAHGSLATVDCLYALTTLLVLLAAVRYARSPSPRRALLVGLALGLAFAAKFTAVLLAVGLLATPLAAPPGALAPRRLARDGLLAACATAGALAAAYLGKGLLQPLATLALGWQPLLALRNAAPWLRLPLPAAFLEGLDASLRSERGWAPIVLLGESHPGGVFYYFPLVWALKTPLLIALLLLLGLWLGLRSRALLREPAARFLLLNLLLTLAYFCFFFRTQIGYRFVLMCIPLAAILAAPALAERRFRRWLAAAALLALFENGLYLGNPLSFTNAAVWPKRQVFRLTADSNLDWGQNRDKIHDWLGARGIRGSRLDPVHVLPGTNVLSVTNVGGVFDFDRFRWLRRHHDPVEHFGHTHLRFEVPYEDFEAYLDEERTLTPLASAAALCSEMSEQPTRGQVPFLSRTPPADDAVWLACVDAPRGTDLGYRVTDGMLRIGRVLADGRCDAELIQHEQAVWYRLAPGRHALCAIEVKSRRRLAEYRSEGVFVLRGRAAALRLAPARLDADARVTRP
jgi:hypothetical protein